MKPDIYSYSPWPFRKLKLNKIDSIQNITINKQFFYQNKKRLLSFRFIFMVMTVIKFKRAIYS